MMRSIILLTLLAVSVLAGPASADPRGDCVAKCAAVAAPCSLAVRKTAETCRLDANKACASVPPAEKFKCLTTALKPCATARNAAAEACLVAFKSCHTTCGPAPAGQAEFWCETEIGGARADYRYDVCAGTAGKSNEDQARDCTRKVAAKIPGAAGQTCDQVN